MWHGETLLRRGHSPKALSVSLCILNRSDRGIKMIRLLFKISTAFIAILLIFALLVGGVATNSSAQANTRDGTEASNMKHIIFRDDDIAPQNDTARFSHLSALKAVNQVHIDKNVPVTLGVVAHPNTNISGNQLLADNDMRSYLQELARNQLFDIAQHGYTHHNDTRTTSSSEFRERPYIDQYNTLKQGRDDITEALGVTPTTFIAPWNTGDHNTLKEATALGFTLYSTSYEDFGVTDATLEGIRVQAASFGIGWGTTDEWQTNMAKVTSYTDAALNSASSGQNIAVFYHYWQFLSSDGSVDPVRLSLFEQYIDHLKSRGDVQFTTLDNQNVLPLSAKTQLNLTASGHIVAGNQSVTLTATLNRFDPATNHWVAVESDKPVQIWHTLNGVRYNDTEKKTDKNGQLMFGISRPTPGLATYYASFSTDESYIASTSNPTTIAVAPTQLNLDASSTTAAINQRVLLTATLNRFDPATNHWVAVESGKPVQIWHTLNGVRYNDTTIATDDYGQIAYLTNSTELGNRTYYASFPDDNVYVGSFSSPLTIYVSDQMQVGLEAWGIIPKID
jgi:peptidoglycan/xylan/chitin deacetylase (PgdA/CDA1 family)